MTRKAGIDEKGRRMLELLAQGASTKVIARRMGYTVGTTRVYLHNLYRSLGVKNRTEAVVDHFTAFRAATVRDAPAAHEASPLRESFGDVALRENLHAALGVMSTFIGPYGRVWVEGLRLRGEVPDERLLARRSQSRQLWGALLAGDVVAAKAFDDAELGARLAGESPAEAVLLALLLLACGLTGAAERLMARLGRPERGRGGVAAREILLLRSLREAIHSSGSAPLLSLHQLASEGKREVLMRQMGIVALFYAYRARRDLDRARATADALWGEAETARRQLEAMGVRPFANTAPPHPTRTSSKPREKAAAPATA